MKRRQVLLQCGALLGALWAPRAARAGTLDYCAAASPGASANAAADAASGLGRASRAMLRSALSRGFGIQYWGQGFTADQLSSVPHGMLIIEATRVGAIDSLDTREETFSPNEIADIRRDGRKLLIGYLNLTEIEYYREYWARHAGSCATPAEIFGTPWIGPLTDTGERLASYWSPEWEAILTERIDRIMALGFDGVFLDDLLHYFSFASGQVTEDAGSAVPPRVTGGYATEMAVLVTRLSARVRAHREHAIVIVNNGVFLPGDVEAEIGPDAAGPALGAYFEAIDGILVESAFGPAAAPETRAALKNGFAERGICVMTVDFAEQHPMLNAPYLRWIIEPRARSLGFVPYVVQDHAFDRLYPACSEPLAALMAP